jgi:hypothetical protein
MSTDDTLAQAVAVLAGVYGQPGHPDHKIAAERLIAAGVVPEHPIPAATPAPAPDREQIADTIHDVIAAHVIAVPMEGHSSAYEVIGVYEAADALIAAGYVRTGPTPDREALEAAIAEAFNTAHEPTPDEYSTLEESHRHGGHQYYYACWLCRNDVDKLAPHLVDAILPLLAPGYVRIGPMLDREALALDLVDWWHAYGAKEPWSVTSTPLPMDLLAAVELFIRHATGGTDSVRQRMGGE